MPYRLTRSARHADMPVMENITGTFNGGPPALTPARVHEASGPAAAVFAFLMARKGEIALCATPRWLSGLHPEACARFCDPDAVLHVAAPLNVDALWAAEACLRSGAVKTVIAALNKAPGFTNFRRLQLAAEKGRALGIVLVERPAPSSAAETRWRCFPLYTDEQDSFRLHASLYKNRRGVVGSWIFNVAGQENTLHMDAAPASEPVGPERIAG